MPRKYPLPHDPIPSAWSAETAAAITENFEALVYAARLAGGGSALANELDILDPAVGDLIASFSAGIFGRLPFVGTATRYLANTGGAGTYPAWDFVNLANGVAGKLPLANLVDFSATQLVWGRNSSGSGVAEEVSLSQLLDWINSAAWGDILYRGQTVWKRLPVGALGFFLQAQGAGADLAWAAAGGSQADNIINQMRWEVHGRTTAPATVGIAAAAYNSAGGITLSNQADSTYVNLVQSAATLNLRAGLDAPVFNLLQFQNEFQWELVMYTGSSITNIRIWMGVSSSQFSDNADRQTTGTPKYCAFRFVDGTDGGWIGTTDNATTQHTTATVAAIAASTRYKLRIRYSGGTVYFSVNGGTEVGLSADLPAAATDMGYSAYQFNRTTSTTHPWLFGRMRCVYGT